MIFINYKNTISKRDNIKTFLLLYGDNIFNLHYAQNIDEALTGYSKKVYSAMLYKLCFNYCLNLMFVSLEVLSYETISESIKRNKELYKFNDIQSNMAHKGIDLDEIFNGISIDYTTIADDQI